MAGGSATTARPRMSGVVLVRDKDGRPKIDGDPTKMDPRLRAMITDDEFDYAHKKWADKAAERVMVRDLEKAMDSLRIVRTRISINQEKLDELTKREAELIEIVKAGKTALENMAKDAGEL